MTRFIAFFLSLAALTGCATSSSKLTQNYSAKDLYTITCGIGQSIQSAEGSVWLKANSKEVTGYYPTTVTVSAPNVLKMAINNVLGGTEAWIQVEQGHYLVTDGSRREKKDEGYGSWGGIPLRWAPALFLGRVPCPDSTQVVELKKTSDGDLFLEVSNGSSILTETFLYSFEIQSGRPWPIALHWENQGKSKTAVDFKFEDREEETGSPKKWEARSERGKVKVHWKDRTVSKVPSH